VAVLSSNTQHEGKFRSLFEEWLAMLSLNMLQSALIVLENGHKTVPVITSRANAKDVIQPLFSLAVPLRAHQNRYNPQLRQALALLVLVTNRRIDLAYI
jgi:hypothetical protein